MSENPQGISEALELSLGNTRFCPRYTRMALFLPVFVLRSIVAPPNKAEHPNHEDRVPARERVLTAQHATEIQADARHMHVV